MKEEKCGVQTIESRHDTPQIMQLPLYYYLIPYFWIQIFCPIFCALTFIIYNVFIWLFLYKIIKFKNEKKKKSILSLKKNQPYDIL